MKRSPSALKSTQSSPRLMLFDLALGGHHGNYIQHLIDYAHQIGFAGEIDIVVLPKFFEIHKDTIAAIANYQHPVINLVTISVADEAILSSRHSRMGRIRRNFREWQLFCKYAKELQATQALIMYLDTYKIPLAVGMQSPCEFSGIYFRPTFHYNTFAQCQLSGKDKLQQWREKMTIKRVLNHPQLRTVFCLDPFAIKAISSHEHADKIVYLADPVQPYLSTLLNPVTLRTKLGIEQHRRVFLLFGALEERKGIYHLLDAIQLLSPELCQKLCLLLIGKTSMAEQAQIQQRVSALRQTKPIQVMECYSFVPENEVSQYFQVADVILVPYQHHVGMSGILLWASVAQKPVLSSDYGLMGELVRRYHLGLAVDSTTATAIASGLVRCLTEPVEKLGDRTQMQAFAEQNTVHKYASTIFHYL